MTGSVALDPRPRRRSAPAAGGRRHRGGAFRWFSAGVALVAAFLVLYPIGSIVLRLFTADGRFNSEAFTDAAALPGLGSTLVNTVVVVACSGLIAITVGFVFAWINERTDAGLPALGNLLPIIPLLVPPVAGAVGWLFLLSPQAGFINVAIRDVAALFGWEIVEGPLNIFSIPGLIAAYSAYLVPYAYIPISTALRNLDPALEEASRVSGMGPWRTMLRVAFPAVRPAIAAGAFLLLVMGLALFAIPIILGSPGEIDVLSVRIVHLVTASYPPQLDTAVVLSLLVMLVVILATWYQNRTLARQAHSTIGGRGHGAQRIRLSTASRRVARLAMGTYLGMSAVLPVLALLFVSFQPFWRPSLSTANLTLENYRLAIFDDPLIRSALWRSIWLAVVSATVGMLLAAILALRVEQGRPKGRLTELVAKLPVSVSQVAIGIGFIAAFAGRPFNLAGTVLYLLLAYLVLYLTQGFLTARAAYQQVGADLVEASHVSGFGPGQTFRRVQLPLMTPGLLGGWSILFVLVMGDLTVSAMLSSTTNSVVGYVIIQLFDNGTYPQLAALATIITVASASMVMVVRRLGRGRDGTERARS